MAKHFYHIPLQNTLAFIKEHRSTLNTLTKDPKALSYHTQLGKSHYILEIENFITFFKIDKDPDYALKTLEYFNSTPFMTELHQILNLTQFDLDSQRIETKTFVYALCHLYVLRDTESFAAFMQKTFLHYHTAFHAQSDIRIDHQEICHALAKSRKIHIKESFGEEGEGSFFKVLLDGELVIDERGKRIKTLRKKAYKKLLHQMIA